MDDSENTQVTGFDYRVHITDPKTTSIIRSLGYGSENILNIAWFNQLHVEPFNEIRYDKRLE